MVRLLRGGEVGYAWGSTTAIQQLLGRAPDGNPLAEVWFGAHPAAPTLLEGNEPASLLDHLQHDPQTALGDQVLARFGSSLPYLLKLIAPASPLSLQVHPDLQQARAGFKREEGAGVPIDASHRLYRDANHKPELVYALTPFRAVSGFRTPRRALELLSGLNAPLADQLAGILHDDPTATGVRQALTALLTPGRVSAEQVREVVEACAQRRGRRGASVRIDRIVVELEAAFPGDPGAVAALLMNPVTLRAGEAMFVPAGAPHAYLSGLGVEIMANSDNVLRAGLTPKHIDADELLEVVDCVAAPPVRIAAEVDGSTRTFRVPVEDFELSVTDAGPEAVTIGGSGPRIVLAVDGPVVVSLGDNDDGLELASGRALFVPADAGPVLVSGSGRAIQAAVP